MLTNWKILNIPETDDQDVIRRAYMTMLPKHNPEDDPEGFARLRAAYEEILNELNNKKKHVETPIDAFMKRLEEVYNDFDRRRDIEEWKELLRDEACMRLDLEDATGTQVLIFLMKHYYLPREVWGLLNSRFDWKSKTAGQYAGGIDFPENFIDFVCQSAEHESLKYDLFNTNSIVDDEQYERWIWLFYEMESLAHMPDNPVYLEMKQEIEAMPIRHVYYDLQIARTHIHKKDGAAALAITGPIFETMPEDNRAWYIHTQAQLTAGQTHEALEHFEKMLAQFPEDFGAKKGLIETMIQLGDCESYENYENYEYYEKARSLLLEILDEFPYNPFALYAFRVVTEKLMHIFEEKYAKNPDDTDIVLTLAKHCLNSYQYDKCQAILEALPATGVLPGGYYEYLADCYVSKYDYDRAIQLYEKNIVLEKRYRNYVKFITILIDAGKYGHALMRVEEALLIDDKDDLSRAYLYDNKGLILHQLKQYNEALDSFEAGLAITGQAAHIFVHKARTYQCMCRYAEAIACCERSIAVFPYIAEAYTIQMEVFHSANLFDRMIALAENAEQIGFENPRIRYHKAVALRMLGQLEQAGEILHTLLNAEFDEGYRMYFQAEALKIIDTYVEENRYEDVLSWTERAVGPFSDVDIRMRLAWIYVHFEQLDKALVVLDESAEKHPEYLADINMRRGLVCHKMERHKDSLVYLISAVSGRRGTMDWDMPYLYNLIGTKYENYFDDADSALKYYQLALEHDPNNTWALKNIENLYVFNVKKLLKASRNLLNKIAEVVRF